LPINPKKSNCGDEKKTFLFYPSFFESMEIQPEKGKPAGPSSGFTMFRAQAR